MKHPLTDAVLHGRGVVRLCAFGQTSQYRCLPVGGYFRARITGR